MTHFGFINTTAKRHRTLCLSYVPTGDFTLPQPRGSGEDAEHGVGPVNCDECLALHLEALLQLCRWQPCGACNGSGAVARADSPGTSCWDCGNSGLTLHSVLFR